MIGKDLTQLESVRRSAVETDHRPETLVELRKFGRAGSIAPMDMTIGKGEIVGLAGLLGSGRTETARLGAVMAIAGAVAAQLINIEGVPFPVVIAAALGATILAGAWNGLLVGAFNVQPIVATLILMVAGRGVAQLITGGQIITFTDHRLTYIGNGSFLGLPFRFC